MHLYAICKLALILLIQYLQLQKWVLSLNMQHASREELHTLMDAQEWMGTCLSLWAINIDYMPSSDGFTFIHLLFPIGCAKEAELSLAVGLSVWLSRYLPCSACHNFSHNNSRQYLCETSSLLGTVHWIQESYSLRSIDPNFMQYTTLLSRAHGILMSCMSYRTSQCMLHSLTFIIH